MNNRILQGKTFSRHFCLFLALACSLILAARASAQYDLSGFLPPGVSVNSATPQQIAEAVTAAVKANPDAAADIAAGSFQSVFEAGRYTLPGSQDGKQSTDPDGSAGDPTLEEWAGTIADAAKAGNPAMAPQIDSAMANALSSAQSSITSGGGGGDGGGGGSGGGAPIPIVPGGGGGGGGGTPSASN